MDSIEKVPSYEEMRDAAVEEYKKEHHSAALFACIGVILVVLTMVFILAERRSPVGILSFIFVPFSIGWLYDSLRKFRKAKQKYQYRLKRAAETLSNANIFIQIPEEDYHRFDSVFDRFRQ